MTIFNKQPQPYDLSNLSILIVEDSIYMQTLTAQLLKIFGVGEIMACSSAKEAKDLLTVVQASKKSKYLKSVDIVLLDWLMPHENGDTLLKWIRSHDNDFIKYLPAIVISGYTTQYIANRARELGAHESMIKPISGTGLASRITSVIENPRPFIKSKDFFGPDRRRKTVAYKAPERRLTITKEIPVTYVKTE